MGYWWRYVMRPNLWGCAPNAIIFSPKNEWHNFLSKEMGPELLRITDLVSVGNLITLLNTTQNNEKDL